MDWSGNLSDWKQDALRRLACTGKLSAAEIDEIWNNLRVHAGFDSGANLPALAPLAKAHIGSSLGGNTRRVKCIRKVNGVNQLRPNASVEFEANGLTIIYGRNGAGKSGFVKVFRTACRTRVEKAETLLVLSDVYGTTAGPQAAEIVLVDPAGEMVLQWSSGQAALDELMHVSVFDSAAAQLYINDGNQIQFLPFGMALPHLLNDICTTFKPKLDAELLALNEKLSLTDLELPSNYTTAAKASFEAISADTQDADIAALSLFDDEDESRLSELEKVLFATEASAEALRDLAQALSRLAIEATLLKDRLSDDSLNTVRATRKAAVDARYLASLKAAELFADEPLKGVGDETWRLLWRAAKDYSTSHAYPESSFPVLQAHEEAASCVLCHQSLSDEAQERMRRFADYMAEALQLGAEQAEQRLAQLETELPSLDEFAEDEWASRIALIMKKSKTCAETLSDFRASAVQRLKVYQERLQGIEPLVAPSPLVELDTAINDLKRDLEAEAETLEAARDDDVRRGLEDDRAELLDLRALHEGRSTLVKRRDLMLERKRLEVAIGEVQTIGNTKKANSLVEDHLKKHVLDAFEKERKQLEISHLKVALERKSGQKKAEFKTVTGTSLTKKTSDFLSEGEQRALALAAFLTEVAVTEGSGPIVLDDPVSSLDRQRSQKVAGRLVAEAKQRQVIVFTHDLVFFNELCREAEKSAIGVGTVALFRDGQHAGKVDPAGVIWKGKSVSKRIGPLKNDLVAIRKLQATSPGEYEKQVKDLYGRLRDTFERAIEEVVFCEVIQRGVDVVQTMRLRHVHISHSLAERFYAGMTKASTHSHDNPAAETVQTPDPDEIAADIAEFEALVSEFQKEHKATEQARPSMKKVV